VTSKLSDSGLWPSVMVDCSHGNSKKDHRRQPAVAEDLATQIRNGSRHVFGVMLESHLQEGKQKYKVADEATYGQSITDACISWEQTEPILEELAAAVRSRRELKANK